MRVILKQDIKGVGRKYEVKEVSDGYANNFLIPRKLAEYASTEAVKKAESLKAATAAEREIQEKLLQDQLEMLKDTKIVLKKKANDKGHLFEKVSKQEIAEALLTQAKINIDADSLVLTKPIKEIGPHAVSVEVGKNKGEFQLEIEN